MMQLEHLHGLSHWLTLIDSFQVEVDRGRFQSALGLLLTFPDPSAGKSQPWYAAWAFLYTPRPSKSSHKLCINL